MFGIDFGEDHWRKVAVCLPQSFQFSLSERRISVSEGDEPTFILIAGESGL
jgi:hypothetical protein